MLFSFQKRRLEGDPIHPLTLRVRLFCYACSDRTRGNGSKPFAVTGEIQIRKEFFHCQSGQAIGIYFPGKF